MYEDIYQAVVGILADYGATILFRLEILVVFLAGAYIKMLHQAHRLDVENKEEKLHIKTVIWENSQRWKFLGSISLIIIGSFISPHEIFFDILNMEYGGWRLGFIAIFLIGMVMDDIFFFLGYVTTKYVEYIKDRFGGDQLESLSKPSNGSKGNSKGNSKGEEDG